MNDKLRQDLFKWAVKQDKISRCYWPPYKWDCVTPVSTVVKDTPFIIYNFIDPK